MDRKFGHGTGPEDQSIVHLYVDAYFSQTWNIGTVESIQICGTDLNRTISPEEFVVKEDTHFGDYVVACQDQCCREIVLSVGARLKDWNLGASNDDSFPQVLQHKGKGRGSVGEGVGPMQDNKSIEELV